VLRKCNERNVTLNIT